MRATNCDCMRAAGCPRCRSTTQAPDADAAGAVTDRMQRHALELRRTILRLVIAKNEKDTNGETAYYHQMEDGAWDQARAALESTAELVGPHSAAIGFNHPTHAGMTAPQEIARIIAGQTATASSSAADVNGHSPARDRIMSLSEIVEAASAARAAALAERGT